MKTNHTLFSMCIAALIGVATGTLTPTTTAAQAQDDESWKGVVYAASNQWGHGRMEWNQLRESWKARRLDLQTNHLR